MFAGSGSKEDVVAAISTIGKSLPELSGGQAEAAAVCESSSVEIDPTLTTPFAVPTANYYMNLYFSLFSWVTGDFESCKAFSELAMSMPSTDFMGKLCNAHNAFAHSLTETRKWW